VSGEDAEGAGAVIDLDERPDYLTIVRDRRILESHAADPGIAPEERAAMERWGEKSALEAPLVFGDEVIGVLTLAERRTVHRFAPEEKELLARLAVPAAIAIHNARLYSEQEERNRHLASFSESSRAMKARPSSSRSVTRASGAQGREASRPTSASSGSTTERRRSGLPLIPQSQGGPGQELVDSSSWTSTRRPQAARRRAIVEETVSLHLGEASRAAMERCGSEKTILNVPLVFNDEPMGVLCLIETRQERHFTKRR
jgi:GAF domain-containing protein